uniref:Uncharacterized protein n=1 Tax=Anguilla anguilla TaxID=7936 RepID=A0A0E9USC1_ANGAN
MAFAEGSVKNEHVKRLWSSQRYIVNKIHNKSIVKRLPALRVL